jgi:outer membrane protein assembly factor BamB
VKTRAGQVVHASRPGGGFVHATATGVLAGVPVVAWGDDAGHVYLADADGGGLRWARRLEVGGDGMVTSIAIGELEGDGAGDVVVTAIRHYDTRLGALARFRGDGTEVFSEVVDRELWEARIVDLDSDERAEIVLAEVSVDSVGDGACSVRALDRAGETLWRRPVNTCLPPRIDIGEREGQPVIAYADLTFGATPHVALLDAQGALLWRQAQADGDGWWVRVTPVSPCCASRRRSR